MQNIKYIVGSVVLYILCIILQVNIFSNLPLFGVIPNLFVIFSVYLGVMSNDKITPSILSVIYGLIYDICFGNFVGLYALLSFIIVNIVKEFMNLVTVEHKIGMMIYVFAFTIVFEIIVGILKCTLGGAVVSISQFLIIVFVTSIYNFILTLFIHPIFSPYIKERNERINRLNIYR